MWVVCINNGKCRGATSKSVSLTIGNKYWVSYVTNGLQRQFKLKNDIGMTVITVPIGLLV